MADRDAVELESFSTELSVAVALTDRHTDGPPVGEPTVRVTNADVEFTETPSGYYVLTDLPSVPATLEVVIESEAYLDQERSITPQALPEDDPSLEFSLEPGPGYPFGSGETVVRGLVEDADGPVAGAEVEYVEGTGRTETDARGDYALPIRDLSSDDLGTDDEGRRALKPDGDDPTIRATHPDGRTSEVTPTVRIGETTSANLSF